MFLGASLGNNPSNRRLMPTFAWTICIHGVQRKLLLLLGWTVVARTVRASA